MGRKGETRDLGSQLGHQSATLRQQVLGLKINAHKSEAVMLRLKHLHNIAIWAGNEVSMPLAALFGHRLQSCAEKNGVPNIAASLLPCQRCETVLQPGYNCMIRIEKSKTKRRKCCKHSQNNIIYTCNFCLHKNANGGTRKGHVKEIYASNSKESKILNISDARENFMKGQRKQVSNMELREGSDKLGKRTSPLISTKKRQPTAFLCNRRSVDEEGLSITGTVGSGGSTAGKERSGAHESSKRRRKSRITLKEIVERGGHENPRSSIRFPMPFEL